MHNLLPEERKKLVKREYHLRLFAVLFFGISFGVISGAVFLIPPYLFSVVEKSSADTEAKLYSEGEQAATFADEINFLNDEIEIIRSLHIDRKVSTPLEGALAAKGAGIKIRALAFDPGDTTASSTLSLSGTAATRDALLAFKKRLEENGKFVGVNLPVGVFTKSKDITFTMSMKITGQ